MGDVGRRGLLTAGTLAGAGLLTATPAAAVPARPEPPFRDDLAAVVLVHGAFNDASSWAGVVGLLQAARVQVQAVQIPLLSLAGDVETVRRVVCAVGRPVVLVGHSYAGAVISGVSGVCADVAALVYCAASVLAEGETGDEVGSRYPATPVARYVQVDAAGFVTVTPEGFVRTVAPDVDPRQAWVRAVSQKPLFSGVGAQPSGPVGWARLPCYYQLSSRDQVISVQAQRDAAERLDAELLPLPAGHLSPVSRAPELAGLIRRALAEVRSAAS